jgi:hypothetical protein
MTNIFRRIFSRTAPAPVAPKHFPTIQMGEDLEAIAFDAEQSGDADTLATAQDYLDAYRVEEARYSEEYVDGLLAFDPEAVTVEMYAASRGR